MTVFLIKLRLKNNPPRLSHVQEILEVYERGNRCLDAMELAQYRILQLSITLHREASYLQDVDIVCTEEILKRLLDLGTLNRDLYAAICSVLSSLRVKDLNFSEKIFPKVQKISEFLDTLEKNVKAYQEKYPRE